MASLQALAEEIGIADFVPDELYRKYLKERDKRLDAGARVYVEVTKDFSHYAADSHADPGFSRSPVQDEVQFAIIGAGLGGLLLGARLREARFGSIRLVDYAGDVGGTWYWNRYPGAACDTESYCYLPLLEETKYIPERKYSFGPEILEHARRIARHYRLYDDALFQTAVTELKWDEQAKRWIVRTDRGDQFKAQYVMIANGPLNRPKLPNMAGINEFKGHSFHTSRWDYSYTGGDSSGNLINLRDKRVGIIGTGATAIQCIPHLAEWANRVYVVQRTPASVDTRDDRLTDPGWANSLQPGWQLHRMANFNAILEGSDEQDLVKDGLTRLAELTKEVRAKIGRPLIGEERGQLSELCDYKNMNRIRALIDEIVKDKATAEALKPWYRQFCKRPCFSDRYLQTFNRPNVKLVNTNGMSVERLTQRGVVVQGQEYQIDCLIFSTGFETETAYTHRAGYDVIGRNGVKLSEYWAKGLRTFHGVAADGFPNCFFFGRTQTGASANLLLANHHQTAHVVYMVSQAKERGYDTIEPSSEAVAQYVAEIRNSRDPQAQGTALSSSFLQNTNERFWRECTPGYLNSEGNYSNDRVGFLTDTYAGSTKGLYERFEAWRREGNMRGMVGL
jgi:cation diffusion facilitator CzcD-associated flavoprotein CzcO